MNKLTATNVKAFDTQDGYAWSADFKWNGKKIGSAHHNGDGGCTNLSDINDSALTEIETYADVTPPHNDFDFERAESVFETLVAEILTKRDEQKLVNKIKRQLKTRVIFYRDKSRDSLRETKLPKGATIDGWTHSIRLKYPDAITLNEMPFDDAFKLLVR